MKPQIIKNENYIEVIGHYDDKVLCAKMTLLADLYAVEHRDGYAKFKVEDEEKLKAVDEKLEFGESWQFSGTYQNRPYPPPMEYTYYNISGYILSSELEFSRVDVIRHSNGMSTLSFLDSQNTEVAAWMVQSGNYYKPQNATTATFATAPTGDLLTWLQANAAIYDPTTTYSIAATATNMTINGSSSYSGTVSGNSPVTLTLAADGINYKLPTSISVSNATAVYTRTSDTQGTLVISIPTNNIVFNVYGIPTIGETWQLNDASEGTVSMISGTEIAIDWVGSGQTGATLQTYYGLRIYTIMFSSSFMWSYMNSPLSSGGTYTGSDTVTFLTSPTGNLLSILQTIATKL